VKKLWQDLKLEDLRDKWCEFTDPKDFVEAVLQTDMSRSILCLALLWNWWMTRIKVYAENKIFTHEHVLGQIRKMARDYTEFFAREQKEKMSVQQSWQAPPQDIQKVNIDGSFSAQDRSGGWGFIIRDSDGDTICSGAGRIPHAQDALQTEAVACIQAMQVAEEQGMIDINVETDALLLVQAIHSIESDIAPNGVLFREIKALASLNFRHFSISYCPRACNLVAGALPHYGAKMVLVPQAIWPGRVPTFAHDRVQRSRCAVWLMELFFSIKK
jgi:ribonuclease HI